MQGSIASGVAAWYDVSSFDPTTGEWASRVSTNVAQFTGTVSLAADAPFTNINSGNLTYINGSTASSITFPEVYGATTSFSVCTVSRYAGGANARIFQCMGATGNTCVQGHYGGYAGGAFYGGSSLAGNWVTNGGTPTANNVPSATSWVSMCVAIGGAASAQAVVNGIDKTNIAAGGSFFGPQQMTINAGAAPTELSNFGVLELITWNRTLTSAELYAANLYLGQRYGFAGVGAASILDTTGAAVPTLINPAGAAMQLNYSGTTWPSLVYSSPMRSSPYGVYSPGGLGLAQFTAFPGVRTGGWTEVHWLYAAPYSFKQRVYLTYSSNYQLYIPASAGLTFMTPSVATGVGTASGVSSFAYNPAATLTVQSGGGMWVQIAMSVNASSFVTFYVNGVQAGAPALPSSSATFTFTTDATTCVGSNAAAASTAASTQLVDGFHFSMQWFNSVLNASQIAQMYNAHGFGYLPVPTPYAYTAPYMAPLAAFNGSSTSNYGSNAGYGANCTLGTAAIGGNVEMTADGFYMADATSTVALTSIPVGGMHTAAMWVYIPYLQPAGTSYTLFNSTSPNCLTFGLTSNGTHVTPALRYGTSSACSGGATAPAVAISALTVPGWNHLAWTQSSTNATLASFAVYLNAARAWNASGSITAIAFPATQSATLGSVANTLSLGMTISSFQWYAYAMSVAQITYLATGVGFDALMYPPTGGASVFTAAGAAINDAVSGTAYGAGLYVASQSNSVNGWNASFAFDNNLGLTDSGLTNTLTYYSGSGTYNLGPGTYNGSTYNGPQFSTAGILGSWLQLQPPVPLALSCYAIQGFPSVAPGTAYVNSGPSAWTLLGSYDNTTWVVLDTRSNMNIANYAYGGPTTFVFCFPPPSPALYSYFRFVWASSNGAASVVFTEVRLYGAGVLPSPPPSPPPLPPSPPPPPAVDGSTDGGLEGAYGGLSQQCGGTVGSWVLST